MAVHLWSKRWAMHVRTARGSYCTSAIACLQANTTNRFARIETAVTARRFVETQVESWHSYAERGARDAGCCSTSPGISSQRHAANRETPWPLCRQPPRDVPVGFCAGVASEEMRGNESAVSETSIAAGE